MTSRTPIRLTPHRGPLATPPTSPESSPTMSTPPADISYCSTSTRPALDITILQSPISPPSPPTRHRHTPRLYRLKRDGRSIRLSSLSLLFEGLIYSTSELAKTLVAVATFCLLLWGLLEWSSYASELPRQPSPWVPMSRFPLPSHTRGLHRRINHVLDEPRGQQVAVLQFLSEQIQHAKALSSLSIGLGLPLRAFLETHRTTFIVLYDSTGVPLVQEIDTLANLTESLDPSFLDFTSGSFIGRSFTLALEELGDLTSHPMVPRDYSTHGKYRHAHLDAIYWRTASNLLLEYSAARSRARRLLQHLHALHRHLSPSVLGHHVTGSAEGKLAVQWWKSIVRQAPASNEDKMQVFVTGLEVVLHNVRLLIAYLDWMTEHLAQTTLKDILKIRDRTDFSSCMTSLQELFTRSESLTSKKLCFCLNNHGLMPHKRPEKVDVMVPGSPTVQAER